MRTVVMSVCQLIEGSSVPDFTVRHACHPERSPPECRLTLELKKNPTSGNALQQNNQHSWRERERERLSGVDDVALSYTREELLDEAMMWHWRILLKRSGRLAWQRKYASRKCGLCAGMRSHLDAMGNRHPNWTKKTKRFWMR